MSQPYLRPLGFGELLDASFTLYRRHFATLVITAAVTSIPMSLAMGTMSRSLIQADPEDPTAALVWIPLMLIAVVVMMISWGALTREASQAATGGEVSVGDGLRSGLRAAFPVVVSGILAYLCLMAVFMVPGMILAILIPLLSGGNQVISAILGVAVVMLLTVLGLGAAASLFAVVPAVVVERKGPIAAIKRSVQLSKGARLRILGILMVTSLIVWLPTLGAMMAAGLGSAMFSPEAAAELTTGQMLFQQIVGFLSSSLSLPFFATCATLLYYDRRVRLEAYDLEVETQELAAIS